MNVDVVLLLSDVPDPRRAAAEDAAMRARVARDIAHAQVVSGPARRRFVFRFTTHEARPALTSRWLGANHRLDDHVGTAGELLTDEQGAQHGRPFRAGHEQVDMNVGAVSALALTAPIRVFYVPSMVTAAAGTSYPPDHPEARPTPRPGSGAAAPARSGRAGNGHHPHGSG